MINTYLEWIEAEIKKQKFGLKPKSLYQPIQYVMRLGGKRVRPLLTLLAYSLFRKDVKSIVPIAVAVEAFHNFTLLHDDIMDQAPLRRGKPTVHEKWNVDTAILSGDVMQIKVYDLLLQIPDVKLRPVLQAFNQCATEVCEGQQSDMEFEKKSKVTEVQYIEMIRQKTAVLLGFSLELGAMLADAPLHDQVALREFGINMGIGFQLKDDLLDVYADHKFGKQIGGDIVANKKTYLLIKALQKAKGKNKQALQSWLSQKKFNRQAKIKAIKSLYDTMNIHELTEKQIEMYFAKAYQHLDSVNQPGKETLASFAAQLFKRQS